MAKIKNRRKERGRERKTKREGRKMEGGIPTIQCYNSGVLEILVPSSSEPQLQVHSLLFSRHSSTSLSLSSSYIFFSFYPQFSATCRDQGRNGVRKWALFIDWYVENIGYHLILSKYRLIFWSAYNWYRFPWDYWNDDGWYLLGSVTF